MADTNGVITFLQYDVVSKFLLPFLLVFFVLFAILEKTKLLGEKKQIHALTAFVIGLIFVSAIYPVLVVNNLILFLTVTLVAVFVVLLIWGFIFGTKEGFKLENWMKWGLGIIVGIAFIIAVVWATGLWDNLTKYISAGIGGTIFTNAIFLIVIAIALVLVLKSFGEKK
jgi:hypothetical protein